MQDGIEEANREDEGFYVRSGIVTVLRNAEVTERMRVHGGCMHLCIGTSELAPYGFKGFLANDLDLDVECIRLLPRAGIVRLSLLLEHVIREL